MIRYFRARMTKQVMRHLLIGGAVLFASVTALFCVALWFEFDQGGLAAAVFSGVALMAVSYLAEKHMDLRPLLVD